MAKLGFIIQKEFKQILRNKAMLPILFIMPLIQLIILSNAATFEIKNISFSYIDHDHTSASRALIDKFKASQYFNVMSSFPSEKEALTSLQQGDIDVVLEIPQHFERNYTKTTFGHLNVSINAINGASAGIENVYVTQIIQQFNKQLKTKAILRNNQTSEMLNISVIPSFWYNETLNYKTFMVPGILVLLVTMISLFLSGMNIVREKEIGTLEQINVTPIKKSEFIIGKLFPFLVLALIILTVGLIIAKFLFNVPFLGNPLLLYGYTVIYILVILGMGLFISNFTDTQQQAMFISWFFMVIFILMSGLFTPIESMPKWAQTITDFNPIKYFVQVVRMVMLKGSNFYDILPQFIKTLLFALVMNGLAVWSYRKRN